MLCDRADYEWAVALVRERALEGRVPVNFSPVHPASRSRGARALDPGRRARVRLNLQLHKYIWGAETKGV